MTPIPFCFSSSYSLARGKLLAAAVDADLAIDSYIHPLLGREGEELALDVVLDGAPDARELLIISSGCHGVEGYCGSGVQVFALGDQEWREKARAAGVAVLYLHGLNPHGFSHQRRVTHEGVDLNRNFHDFSQPLPEATTNAGYSELHELLLPQSWPPGPQTQAAIEAWMRAHAKPGARDAAEASGLSAFQAAVTRGQYSHADGLFYGGNAPTWSNATLRAVLGRYATRCEKLAWIDVHTGLGPRGHGERIFACRDDRAAFARAQAWWGNQGNPTGQTPITSIFDGSSSSAFLTGLMGYCVYEDAPQAQYTAIALEYGTVSVNEVLDALRADHWLAKHPQAPAALAAQIKQQIMSAFYIDADDWKGQVISQARQAMFQSVQGLTGA